MEMEKETSSKYRRSDYKPVPPDGGWGYVITVALIVMNCVSLIPLGSFGLLYGKFLSSIGDEASGSSLTSSIFMSMMSFTGLISGYLLKSYGPRISGFVGAISFSAGCFGEIFGTNLIHMIICYSVLKGCGYGLMQTSSLSAMNSYFDKKHSYAMGLSQTLLSTVAIVGPKAMAFLMDTLEFKKTLWVVAGISLLNFPAMATYRPLKKQAVEGAVTERILNPNDQTKPHMEQKITIMDKKSAADVTTSHVRESSFLHAMKKWLLDTMGWRICADLKYLNMSIGLA
ncbi:hypothetical protein JTB14_012485 [Gonioctena quinquepunctata]|nr:hypothetical protein JTB14_012485 [Gonioctena quinquepunctata]